MTTEPPETPCGMTLPVNANISPAAFQQLVRVKLLRDAINTLVRLNRPLVFELYCEPERGVAGWRECSR